MVTRGINHLHDASSRPGSCVSVTDMVVDSVLSHMRDLYRDLSVEEKQVLRDFIRSEKPVAVITTIFSAHDQAMLIDEVLREGSFTNSKIPSYIRVALNGISASQKFYSSFWQSKSPLRVSNSVVHAPEVRHKPVKVSVYRPQDRFDHRLRRPGGVHVGPPRKPLQFKVYNETQRSDNFFQTIHNYMRSILPDVF